MSSLLEEGNELSIDFNKLNSISENGLFVIPAIVQDANTLQVLMMGYVNQEALEHSIQNKVATFWSTSRNELWVKGKTSGEFLDLVQIRINCEQNSLLYFVQLRNEGACHTLAKDGSHRKSCYYRILENGFLRFT
jgi:phosphoribosyl-AMP cyclohydrolase